MDALLQTERAQRNGMEATELPVGANPIPYSFSPTLAFGDVSPEIRGFHADLVTYFGELSIAFQLLRNPAARRRALDLLRSLLPLPPHESMSVYGHLAALPELVACAAIDPDVIGILPAMTDRATLVTFDRLTKARQITFSTSAMFPSGQKPGSFVPVWVPDVWDSTSESLKPVQAHAHSRRGNMSILVPRSIGRSSAPDIAGQYLSFVRQRESCSRLAAYAYAVGHPHTLMEFVKWRRVTGGR